MTSNDMVEPKDPNNNFHKVCHPPPTYRLVDECFQPIDNYVDHAWKYVPNSNALLPFRMTTIHIQSITPQFFMNGLPHMPLLLVGIFNLPFA